MTRQPVSRNALGVLVMGLLVAWLYLWMFTASPIWQDEIQIVEYGRLLLQPGSDWSVIWLMQLDSARFSPTYLGELVQEIAYRVSQPGIWGPRLASMSWALLAAVCAGAWALLKSGSKPLSMAVGLLLLLDPLFLLSYRLTRVDSMAIALIFAALLFLGLAVRARAASGSEGKYVAGSGALTAASLFVWPTAITMVPLVLLELGWLSGRRVAPENRIKATAWVTFITAGMVTGLVLSIPLVFQLDRLLMYLNDDIPGLNSGFAVFGDKLSLSAVIFARYSPLLPMIFALAVMLRKDLLLISLFALTAAVIGHTNIYEFRLLYLLPWFIYGIVRANEIPSQARGRASEKLIATLLAAAVLWSGFNSLVLRPRGDATRGPPQHLEPLAAREIGSGPRAVYLGTWDFYYTGRQLGWKMYKPFYPGREWSLFAEELLPAMDYAILESREITEKRHAQLMASGFTRYREASNDEFADGDKPGGNRPGYGKTYRIYRK